MAEDRLPGEHRETQPTVLVSGGARELLRRVPLQLLSERLEPGDGVVIVTAREDPGVVARRLCGAVAAARPDRVALIDVTSKAAATSSRVDDLRWHVPSPVAFGGIATVVDTALGEPQLRNAARVHFLFDTLSTQFRLADADLVGRHAHELSMTVGAETGLGVFGLERAAVTDREFHRVRHLVDVSVSVRRTANGPQVRWTGVVGDSDGWVSLAVSGFRFDALGRSLG